MREGNVISLIESHRQEHGEDRYAAYEASGKQFKRLIESGKLDPHRDISIKALFNACLKERFPNEEYSTSDDVERLAEAVGSTSFPNITKYIISSQFIPTFERGKDRVRMLFTEDTASRTDVERIAGFTESEGLEYTPEEYPVQSTDFHEKWAEVQIAKFTKSIGLTKEAIYNDNTGKIINKAASIGKVFGQQLEKFLIETIEVKNRSLLPNESGTGTSQYCAKFDGSVVTQAIFYVTDHSSYAYMGAQTNANLATSCALSNDKLDTALRLFANMVDERGEGITVTPETLLVHTNNAVTAWQLTKSMGQADTANQAKNYWGPGGVVNFKVVVSNYISTSTDWYMGDFPSQIVLLWWLRPNVITQGSNSEASFSQDIIMKWAMKTGFGAANRDYRYVAKLEA